MLTILLLVKVINGLTVKEVNIFDWLDANRINE